MPPSIERYLNIRACGSATLSPAGDQLAFLYNLTGTAQVYRLDQPGHWPEPLTGFPDAVRQLKWSPIGEWIAVAVDSGGDERDQIHLVSPDGFQSRALTRHPQAIHGFGDWSADGTRVAFHANRRHEAHFDLYVQEVGAEDGRCVLEAEGHNAVMGWSPSGDALLFRHDEGNFEQGLRLLDLATGEVRPVSPAPARYHFPHFTPDGRCLHVVTDLDRDTLGVARLDLGTRALEYLYTDDWDVEGLDASPGGRWLAYSVNRDGYSRLFVAVPGNPQPYMEIDPEGALLGFGFNPQGTRLWYTAHGPTSPPEVCTAHLPAQRSERWTRVWHAGIAPSSFVAPELARYPSFDGRQIPVFIYRPREAGGPVPVVVSVHGGPEGQERPGFSPVYQYLVNRGYAVAAPNIRGSTGYGKAYSHLDDVEKRPDALRDVEHLHHWLAQSGWADPQRIAIMGGSYGGYAVLACLTRFPDLWAAGIDLFGVANFETFFRHTGPWRRQLRAREYGDPDTQADLLRELSPVHRIDQIRAPLLVIQGANDPRVPQEESDQVVASLRGRGLPVEYLVFDDEGHGLTKLPNRIRAYSAVAEFLDRYLSTRAK